MFNVGPEKLMVVLLVALIVLGPDKLPNAARQIGRYLNDFRRISQGFQQELRSAIDMAADPVTTLAQPTPTDPHPTAEPDSSAGVPVEAEPSPTIDATDPTPVDETPTTVAPPPAHEDAAVAAETEPIVVPPVDPVVTPVAEPVAEPEPEPVAEPNHTASA